MNPTLEILAVAAGALTVLSPCILPILPALLSASARDGLRHRPFWIVLGLAISFTVFGVAFAVFGTFLGLSNAVLRDAALAILLFFGLSLLWPRLWEGIGARVGALARKIPGADRPLSEQGRGSALLVGGSLGLVWAPCAGPILGIIITVAAVQGAFGRSLLLLSAYSLGAAVPMLAIGYGGRRLYRKVLSLGRWGDLAHRALGVVTIATVVALFFNLDTLFLSRLPGWLFPAGTLERKLAGANPGSPAPGAAAPGVAVASTAGSSLPVLGTMPEFTGISAWLNSPPLSAASLRGKVVLVDFWTYSCINCIRTLPYVSSWYDKYRDRGFVVVGVHTPEFAFEKDEGNVKNALVRYGISYPVALDNRYGTWSAYNNNVWPAHYLFDARGRLREVHFGEGDYDGTERAIQSLLMEARLLHAAVPVDRPKGNVDFSKIDSPETYVGYGRARDFSSPEAPAHDRRHRYTMPPSLGLNRWALRGPWKITEEAAVLEGPAGAVRFHFEARQLNLVMSGAGTGGVKATVLLDGKPVAPDRRGADAGPDGRLAVSGSRLYNLVDLSAKDGRDHVFEIDFEGPGVALYAFTFG